GSAVASEANNRSQAITPVAWGMAYAAAFLYLFLLRPAPPQTLRGQVIMEAIPRTVALVERDGETVAPAHQDGRERALSQVIYHPLKAELLQWVAGKPFSATSLLVAMQQVRMWTEHRGNITVLKAEMRWQVRGGLLGKSLDALLSGSVREEALA